MGAPDSAAPKKALSSKLQQMRFMQRRVEQRKAETETRDKAGRLPASSQALGLCVSGRGAGLHCPRRHRAPCVGTQGRALTL